MSIHTGYADIVIITALRVEFNALLNILESPVELPGENDCLRSPWPASRN